MSESEVETRGLPTNVKALERLTLGEILERYGREISPTKRGRRQEISRIRLIRKNPISAYSLTNLTEGVVAEFRDQRLKVVKPSTIVKELALLSHCVGIASRDWGYPIPTNVFAKVRKPSVRDARDRRLTAEERQSLDKACRKEKSELYSDIIQFAVETAMRKGEILNAQWKHIDFKNQTLHIPITKNGCPRTIPLSPRASAVLRKRAAINQEHRVFGISERGLRKGWRRLMQESGIKNFRFHDLRHEGVSTLIELGLSVPEVALVSGHQDFRLLARYVHLRPENVAAKLAKLTQASQE
ncbi:site-specific integrase [Methylobacterium soli]|uniref:site-specific integrase n=1 Tax=Methylobacterium soli TaxID=553447 RepID=UPI00178371C7|nr:site-specific integrase [Methylobacterium soli]